MFNVFGTGVAYRRIFGLALALVCAAAPGSVLGQTGGSQGSQTKITSNASIDSLFTNFLHYARVGRFTAADAYAQALINHTDLDPVELLALADRDRESVKTLHILIKNSTIGDNASKVLDLLRQGEHEKRRSADRIRGNIEKLGGDPQQEYMAIKYLRQSGEYAIPQMVQTLLDPSKKQLWPRVINALPKIGKAGVNPLVITLSMSHNNVRLNLIEALGRIGYPQAIPYLRKLEESDQSPPQTKEAALAAIDRIERITGRSYPGSAADGFASLSAQYFHEQESVRADPRLDEANVWYWNANEEMLTRKIVPTKIFGVVMSMRSSEETLRLDPDHSEAIALWLASNIRREARLGFNVESGDPKEEGELDNTRPDVFPRALYFSQAAGPRYAHNILDLAVRFNDSALALGAIKALHITAGTSSLIGTEGYKQPLVKALHFSDSVVRLRAALALGSAMPKTPFTGSDFVVPVLASALSQTGREQILVIDPDEDNLNRIVGELRTGDREVVGDTSYYSAMERARNELQTLSGVFIATDIRSPDLREAMQQFRESFVQAKTPVVVLTKPREDIAARSVAEADAFVEIADAMGEVLTMESALSRVRDRSGQARLDPATALSLALESARTLRALALDGGTVLDPAGAEASLIGTLTVPEEELQTAAASVLALINTPTAQRAIAHVSLDDQNAQSLRVATFGSLAESAKNNGNLLEAHQVTRLVEIARHDDNLTIRTAASESLGALNLATDDASQIIRSYYGG